LDSSNSKRHLSLVIPAKEAVSQVVIPAKSAYGREPGSRRNLVILAFHWIPDLAPRSGARPEWRLWRIATQPGKGESRKGDSSKKRV